MRHVPAALTNSGPAGSLLAVRARRPKTWTRKALALFTVLLTLVLVGRGHVFQAIGLPVACGHAEDAEVADSSQHDEQGDHEGCPPTCQRCACGHMPIMPAIADAQPHRLLRFQDIPDHFVSQLASSSEPQRLDRPPRAARA
jgi:hypothetical protein